MLKERIFFMSKFFKTKNIAAAGILIAAHIVFARILSFESGPFKISLGFLPVCIGGMVFGPLGGGFIGAVSDLIGCLIFSRGQVYFPLFTLSEFLYGFGFGIILHKQNRSLLKITLFTAAQFIILNILLQSCWLYLYYILVLGKQKGLFVLMSARLTAAAVNLPVQLICVNLISKYLRKPISNIGR